MEWIIVLAVFAVGVGVWYLFFWGKDNQETSEPDRKDMDFGVDAIRKQKTINALLKVGQINQLDAIALRKNRSPSKGAQQKFTNAYRHSLVATDYGVDAGSDLLFLFAAAFAMDMILPNDPMEEFLALDPEYASAFESEEPSDFGVGFGVRENINEPVVYDRAAGDDFTPSGYGNYCSDDDYTCKPEAPSFEPSPAESSDSYSSTDSCDYGGGSDDGSSSDW